MQTKLHSFLESLAHKIIGFINGMASQLLIFPLLNIDVSFTNNILICTWFTCTGMIIHYVIRRWFTKRTE